jgi:glycosyltransferase involved in cell wall biosynthesis
LKIVYLNPTGTLGGAEMCLLDILATLGQARPQWRPSVVLGADGPLRTEVEALGVSCLVLPLPASLAQLGDASLGGRDRGTLRLASRGARAACATAWYLGRLKRVLRAARPDRVQTNSMKAHVLGAWAAPAGVPVVWHLHDYLSARLVMGRLLRRSAGRRVVGVAVSESVAADARGALGARVPIRTIPNAIDLERFAPGTGSGAALDAAAGLPPAPPDVVRVGLVATFARWKGHEVFLDAVARLGTELPCRYYVVGGPIYQSLGSQFTLEELRTRAAALGLDGRLGFTGFQADPAAALRALDIVVHASTRPEPFGRVIVEAMACGRSLIAVPAGGAAELFEDGISALACQPGDPAALAAAIARLVADPELRRRLGAAGRQAALEHFDRRRLASQWSDVYEESNGQAATPQRHPVLTGERPARPPASSHKRMLP